MTEIGDQRPPTIFGADRAWLVAQRAAASGSAVAPSSAPAPAGNMPERAQHLAAWAALLFQAFQAQGFHDDHALQLTLAVLATA